ncbi:MAG: hypothetical protein JNK72_02800 [Myxococcales bacterium]|nr:hypothetical protein [Myxococcales bacterium]
MFKETLREIVEGTDGAVAGLLMGFDGIEIDKYSRDDSELDIQTIGMELSGVLGGIGRATQQLEAGVAREVAIQAEKFTIVVRVLNPEYVVALALNPGANFGKGRFLLRVAAPRLLEALG